MLRMQLSTAQRRCELAGMLEPRPSHKRKPSILPGQPPDSRMGGTHDECTFQTEKGHWGKEHMAVLCLCLVISQEVKHGAVDP